MSPDTRTPPPPFRNRYKLLSLRYPHQPLNIPISIEFLRLHVRHQRFLLALGVRLLLSIILLKNLLVRT